MQALIQIFLGSVLLSVVHASIPNHWLPLVAIGRVEKWSERETLTVTAITGIAHTLSTIIIGIIVGMIGYKLSETYHIITHSVAPSVLVVLGVYYLYKDYKHSKIKDHHEHSHIDVEKLVKQNKSKRSIVTSLSVAMFFSPCIEVEVYYFTAARIGWLGIIIVSITYFIVTILGMMLLVKIGTEGVQRLKLNFVEHREKLISGLVLITVGLLAFFVEF